MIVYSVIIWTCRIVFCKLYKFNIISVCVRHSVMSDFCDPVDGSLPGYSVHGILQAGAQEWVAISSSIILSMHILFGVLDRSVWSQNDATRTSILSILSSISQQWFALLALTFTVILYRCLMDALGIWYSRFFRVLPGILFQILISFELLLKFAHFFWIDRAFFLQWDLSQ